MASKHQDGVRSPHAALLGPIVRLRTLSMRQSLALIAGLMLVLTLWAGISASAAHAAEIAGCIELSVADAGLHAPGDGDEVPGDADNPMPHHHGSCHNHHLSVPAIDGLAAVAPGGRTSLRIGAAVAPDAVARERDLRPPIA
ncbi:hypothetical protein E5A73_01330 [Sphingomonas gei]|uniref:DUF2946 domain-containing protein n=1 Tax=Sphingomonas gei TaxID=1395960 RepID=A0A4S1XGP7_9SPHN|nr:hypothetical protein [Sphingomonas gei]TGX55799.1 hypothetical protein E5A73_01330 [Sphingomonas gei]